MLVRQPYSPFSRGGRPPHHFPRASQTAPKPRLIRLRCIKGGVGPFVFNDTYLGTPDFRGDRVAAFWIHTGDDWMLHAASLFEPVNTDNWHMWPLHLQPILPAIKTAA